MSPSTDGNGSMAPKRVWMGKAKLNTVRVKVSDLLKDPKNAKTHSEKNLKAIEDSFAAWGQVEPLVVQQSTMRLIAGHGRLDRLKKTKVDEVDVVLLDVTDAEAREMSLTLNRTPELGGWDDAKVAEILAGATSQGRTVPGYSEADTQAIIDSVAAQAHALTGGDASFGTSFLDADEIKRLQENREEAHEEEVAEEDEALAEAGEISDTPEEGEGGEDDGEGEPEPEVFRLVVRFTTRDSRTEVAAELLKRGFECREI